MNTTAIIYTRFSPRPNAAECESMQAQAERCERYCEMRNFAVVGAIQDPEISAGRPMLERPGGKRLIAQTLCRNPDARHVIIDKLDRGFRNAADCLGLVERWNKNGISLHIVSYYGMAIDTSSAMGKLFLTFLAGFAEFERNLIVERTSEAMRRHQAQGRAMNGEPPYGKRRLGKALVPHGGELATIQAMVTMEKEGTGLREICRRLNRAGMTARSGQWHHTTIKTILDRHRGTVADEVVA